MAGIVVVGSYNRDVVLSVARFPAPGETCLSLGRMETDGGKGSNQAIQAVRCGADVAMLAAVGEDAAGAGALALWEAHGIDVGGVARLPSASTGMAMILVDGAAENLIVVDSGANAALSPAHLEAGAGADRLQAADLVLAQLETPADATRAAFALARAERRRTVLNAAPATALRGVDALLAQTDILVVNAGEGAELTGLVGLDRIGPALLARVGEAVVVTQGAEGATLFRRSGPPVSVRPPPVRPVDTTGAGDAFIGAFCARLVQSGDMADAVAWGVVAGALACTRPGAAASYADRAEIAAGVEAAGDV